MSRLYQVGDVCRIRGWEDMASEYGTFDSGTIACPGQFPEKMRDLCGRVFTVKRIDPDGRLYSKEDTESLNAEGRPGKKWIIKEEMLEPYFEDTPIAPVSIPGW